MSQQELELPQGWDEIKFGEFIELKNGINFTKNEKGKIGIPTIDVFNMYSNTVYPNTDNVYRVNKKTLDAHTLKNNDLLFVRSSVKRQGVGWATLFKESNQKMSYCGFIIRARYNTNKIIPKYLLYYFRSPEVRNYIVTSSSQVVISNINQELLSKIVIPLPPLNEQKRIVFKIEELLSKIDSAKQSLEQIKLKLKNYRISFLKFIFEVKKSELLPGWRYVKLENIVKTEKHAIKRGPFGSHLKKSFFVKKGYKVYEQKHAINNDFTLGKYYITEQKFQDLKSFEIKSDDIIISCSGTIGKLAVVPENFQPGIINQALLKISIDKGIMDIQLFKYLFEFWMLKTEVQSHGSGMGNLSSVKALKEIPILLAPKEQQQEMISQIEQGFSLIENTTKIVESTLQNLQTMKMSILKQAFEGKLVPQDPNDEPASVLLEKIKSTKESQSTKQRRTKNVK
jgi:type I restriction enzyme, S subunit